MSAAIAEVSALLEQLGRIGDFYLMVKPVELQLEKTQVLVQIITDEQVGIMLTPTNLTGSDEARQALSTYADAGLCLVQGSCPASPAGSEWVQYAKPAGIELRLVREGEVSPGADLHRAQTFTKQNAELLSTEPPVHTNWGGAAHISHHAQPDPVYRTLYV